MKRLSLKQLLLVGVAVVVTVTVVFGVSSVPQYKTTTITTSSVQKVIDFTTNWYPVGYAKVAIGASSDIKKIQVKEGEKVSSGKVLAQLNDDIEYNQYKAAQASYYAAIRAKKNALPGTPQSSLDTMQGQINSAYYQLKNTEVALNKKKIKSPISGRVTTISVADFTSPAATANNYIVIANSDDSSFTATVSGRDIARLQKGMKVTLTTRISDEVLIGKISKLAKTPVIVGVDDPVYQITVSLDKYPSSTPFGTKLEGAITIADKPGVQAVQYDAITIDSATDGSVLVLKEGNVETKVVKIGVVGDDLVEVVSGVSNEDQIVVDQLPDKKIVTFRPWLKKLLGIKQ